MTPACVAKHSTGTDANAALVGPSKAKLPWNDVKDSDKATSKEDDHNIDTTHADISRLHSG